MPVNRVPPWKTPTGREWPVTIRDLGGALRRHPAVTLVAVALTLATALWVKVTPPEYEARSALTLLSPQTRFPRNSYAGFTPALVTNADVTARMMASERMRARVRAAGGTAGYQVLLANRGNQEMPVHDQPHLTVVATAPSAAAAERTHAAVLEVMRAQLAERQRGEGAQTSALITWQITAGTGRAVPITGRPSRRYLAIGLLGAIATLYAAVAADRRGRAPRRFTGRSRPARRPAGAGA
jgi:hypothetical protein